MKNKQKILFAVFVSWSVQRNQEINNKKNFRNCISGVLKYASITNYCNSSIALFLKKSAGNSDPVQVFHWYNIRQRSTHPITCMNAQSTHKKPAYSCISGHLRFIKTSKIHRCYISEVWHIWSFWLRTYISADCSRFYGTHCLSQSSPPPRPAASECTAASRLCGSQRIQTVHKSGLPTQRGNSETNLFTVDCSWFIIIKCLRNVNIFSLSLPKGDINIWQYGFHITIYNHIITVFDHFYEFIIISHLYL